MYEKLCKLISKSKHTVALTGAGISVESGIPPFRGKDGLWNKIDPMFLDISYFLQNQKKSWEMIRQIFYQYFGKSKPNDAHYGLATLEKNGFLSTIITQNIDNLHQDAGSQDVIEFHGTAGYVICIDCGERYSSTSIDLEKLPPVCNKCHGLLKPDFIFFGEPIPEEASRRSFEEANKAELLFIIGTSGEVMPASLIPQVAKRNNATIIEINAESSHYTNSISDVVFQDRASVVLNKILSILELEK